jgi:hypothetical protein
MTTSHLTPDFSPAIIIGKGRLVIGGKGFIIDKREYITVCKRE